MNFQNIQVEYRSLRLGFCVRNGNVQDLVRASKLSTLLWGGAYNPIIPVDDPNGLGDDLVKLFQVDILIPIADVPEIKAFTEKYKWARFPMLHHSDTLFTEDSHKTGYQMVRVLDVSHLFQKLWDKEFKFAAKDVSNCGLVTWKANDPHKDLMTLLFGSYPKEKLSYPYETNFKKALRAQEIKVEATKTVPVRAARLITPIVLTQSEIKSYGGGRNGSGVYIGDPSNFTDLLNFWNIRASGTYLTFLPKTDSARFKTYVKGHVARIRKGKSFGEDKIAVSVYFIAENDAEHMEIQTVAKLLEGKDKVLLMNNVSGHSWNGLNISPSYNVIKRTSCMADLAIKYGKPTVTVQLSDKPFLKKERDFRDQYFVASIALSVTPTFPEHTTALPILPDLNEWYSREMVFDTYSIRVTKSLFGTSLGVITETDKETLEVNPIEKYELIKKVFERASITARKSGAGLVAERLIALMAGVGGSARIFKITGVRKFIEDTSPLHHQIKFDIQKKIEDNGSFNNFVGQFGLNGSPLTTEQVFDTMLERNLLQAGIEVRCPKCSLKTWLSLKDVGEIYACEFCQEKTKLVEAVEPITMAFGAGAQKEIKTADGTRWYYRLSGLMGKSDKQQGAIPVILTLQHLANRMHDTFGSSSIYSTAIELEYEVNGKKQKGETDLVLFDMNHRMGKRDFEILIGECKTGQQITRAQIDRLVEVKELIEKSGVKCQLVFTKTKGKFSNAEIGHFKRLVASGTKPVLFTSNELERWWDEYKNFKTSRPNFKLPYEHPFTFDELAENAAYVYQL